MEPDMIKKVKPKPLTLSQKVANLELKIIASDSYIESQIDRLGARLLKLENSQLFHSEQLSSHKNRIKKTEEMHGTIRKCHTKITTYNSINNKSVNFYNKVILRMREIQKDYDALFRKMGTTITFFERREPGEDWIPGDPIEGNERSNAEETEANLSSQLQKMEEKLDD